MDEKDPMSRREMLRAKLGLGLFQSIGYSLGRAHGVTKHIEKTIREPPPPAPPEPEFPIFLRPPGAVDELSFVAQCTKCNSCVDACPPMTLVALTGSFSKAYETPVIDPSLGGCTMCSDRPCAAACANEGIDILDALLPTNMGHAMIHRSNCTSHIGDECALCIDSCPIEHAIKHGWRKIPTVDNEICTGCGLCLNHCPVEPKAISIIPTKDRPPKTGPDNQSAQDQNAQGPSPD